MPIFLFLKLFPSSTFLLYHFVLLVILSTTQAATKVLLPCNETISALIVFGDSILDTGNNNNLNSLAKSNFPPYGRDFKGGIPTGRFSNGKVPSDFLVEELGIKELLPAYADPTLQPEDLLTGVCFASGGSGYDPLTSEILSTIPLSLQLQQFKEYTEKLKRIVGEERTNTILAKSVYLLVAGSNDIAITYFTTRARELQYDVSSYTDLMIGLASKFVKELYGLGARRIGVFNVPPIGCVPFSRTTVGGIQRECPQTYNQAAQLFNAKLSSNLESLNTNLADSRVVYIDIYSALLDLIKNPKRYGFEIVDKGCCGTGTVEAAILCNRLTPCICTNVSSYLFWDSFHPTEKAYKALTSRILQKYINSFFFSLALLLLFCFFPGALQAAIKLPCNETISAVIVFGDSIVDTGNNNNILNSVNKCNFPPYGRDFKGGIPTGRCSNGKIPSDFIVEELGIKELLPAYANPNLKPEDLLTGVSFASGGSGYDPLTPQILTTIPLSVQLQRFKEYTEKLKMIVGDERTNTILAKSVYFLVAGSNDIAATYFTTRARELQYNVSSYTDILIGLASKFVKELYELGARRIGVFNVPTIGCVPFSRTTAGGIQRECPETYNQAAQLFNAKLSSNLESLNTNLADSRVVYVDIYSALLDLIKHPKRYGFEIVDKGCCGTGTVEVGILCNQLTPGTCTNDSSYLFWDSFHPTEKAYKILTTQIIKKYIKSFFFCGNSIY
ncbi:Lipase_GDSL domain-containing protein [Cephalotus follicularis]|uniref:Lipase_GDSL domain-containing protein n=1 Tax=Cephalotus follicularis TaxID=3775 RepID=A0A1Q3AM53_CEPFO|nr:Lipase_GDSL domain-containing protein [Cephalotus follicularis]